MKMQNCLDVGIYCRLSRDDHNGNLESMSIANQRQILSDYVKEKGWILAETYVDDGWSGTNFDRPDFNRMLADIKTGRINCVITKDLSRLGRNYSITGYYTDEYFPEQNVRYIAINDGVDTMVNNNDFAAFSNVINEYYPRDISRKVRQVKKKNAEKGMFMGSQAPYGYKKSPEDKHVLIIDEQVAPFVQRIFDEIALGENGRRIAGRLNEEGIPCPSLYHYQTIGKTPPLHKTFVWGSATVLQIASNQAYIGNMVQGKRQVVSFKSKKRRTTDPEDWIIVENTHEPIIDRELWNDVQKKHKEGEHFHTPSAKREVSIFAGLVKCADCGSTMSASLRGRQGKQKLTYRCDRYSNSGKDACPSHNIREEVLETIVLNDIHSYAKLADEDKQDLIERVLSALKSDDKAESNLATKQLAVSEQKVDEINTTVKSLYKDKLSGKMPEKFFYSLLSDYEIELKALEEKIPILRDQVKQEDGNEEKVRRWADTIQKYINVQHLDRFTARELIESISVSAYYKVNGKTTQDVTINYRFVGNLQKLLDKAKDVA